MKIFGKKKIIEDFAIKIMYFLNTMDSFLPFSIITYFILSILFSKNFGFFVPFFGNPGLVFVLFIFFYAIFKISDFYPTVLIFIPLYFYFLIILDPYWVKHLIQIASFAFIFTSLIQIVFMGIPMSLAARRPDIPFRIYFNSFLIISPTTISLALNTVYLTFFIYGCKIVSENPFNVRTSIFLALLLLGSIVVRKTKRKNVVTTPYHPLATHTYFKRVVLLNIDGLSYIAFKKSNAVFLKRMEKVFCGVEGGAKTVYRALTNPALVSILTGAPPDIHGIRSNNVGSKIKVEALPDFIKTKLYGSMHVRHFSRKEWAVKVFSLVELGFDKADSVMMEKLKEDILQDQSTALWVVDLNETDYCGHAWGSYSKEYYNAIVKADNLIKNFIEWLNKEGLLEETMVVVSSDHGLFITEHSFLIFSAEEFVPLIFIGKGIFPMQFSFPISIVDICANVSYFLGERYCSNDNGRVFGGMFKDSESFADFERRFGFEKKI